MTTQATVAVNSLAVSAAAEQISCFGEEDGVITVSAGGGSAPYQYSIDGGMTYQSVNEFDGLDAGTYEIIVTDVDGLSADGGTITLENPSEITAEVTVIGSQITVTATGGSGELEYSLDGEEFQSDNVFNDLENGEYVIYIQDENECMIEVTAIVSVNDLGGSASVVSMISCFGGENGAVEVNAFGGNPPYQYSIDNGVTYQDDNYFSGLPAGQYVFRISDNDGFTFTTEAVFISQPAELQAAGNTEAATVTVTAEGGIPPYQYNVNGGDYTDENVFADLPNGVYDFGVVDANGCTVYFTEIIAMDEVVAAVIAVSEISCFGGNDGAIVISAEGGTLPYLYSLDGENFQESNAFDELPAGTFTVTVQDATGAQTQTEAVTLNDPAQLNLTVAVSNFTAELTAVGGTPPYSYSLDDDEYQDSNIFTDLENGDYVAYAEDDNGCIAIFEFTVAVNSLFAEALIAQEIACHNEDTGIIQVNAGGGTEPFMYSLDGENFQESDTFTDLPAGTYSVTVTDAAGFSYVTEAVVLTQPSQLILEVQVVSNNIFASANGGTASYMYSINGLDFQSSGTFSELPSGDYTVTVTDANGCTETLEVSIIVDDVTDLSRDIKFSVFPNPAYAAFTVEIENELRGNLQISLYNVVGQLLRTQSVIKDEELLQYRITDLDLPAGTYQVRVENADFVGVRKVVLLR